MNEPAEVPTPEEILERAAAIRANWSDEEHRRRAGCGNGAPIVVEFNSVGDRRRTQPHRPVG
jgi:hypothetical protein